MLADELACYQEKKRAEIAATGVIPEEIRVNVEWRFRLLGIERDSTAFWEGFVGAIRTTSGGGSRLSNRLVGHGRKVRRRAGGEVPSLGASSSGQSSAMRSSR
jgi:hypothetical protein